MQFIGNQKIVQILQKSIKNKAFTHAYLFSGPEKVGKFALAKKFAASLIEGSELSLDMEYHEKNSLLDLIVVEPEIIEKKGIKKQRAISIESIRDAKLNLSLFPYHGLYKVLIINDAHKMNIAAQNAILKILEEPNPTTVIILVAHESDKILPTIFSRCQQVNFALVSEKELENEFDCEIISLSLGRPGYAKLLSKNEQEKDFAAHSLEQLNLVLRGSLNEKFALAEQLSKDAIKTIEELNLWLWEIRKRALASSDAQRQNIFAKIEKIQESMHVLKGTNANARLILETLFMDL